MEQGQINQQLQMARLAYQNHNYGESYQLSSNLLLENTSPQILAEAWRLKGLSAGALSTFSNNRLEEMLSYINKGLEITVNREQISWVALEIASIVAVYARSLQNYYTQESNAIVRSNKPAQVQVRYQNEGFGEALGRGIGQGLAEGLDDIKRTRKASVSLGHSFIRQHMYPLFHAMEYAYRKESKRESVAYAIGSAVNAIIDTTAISPRARREFSQLVDELTSKIINSHPDMTIYYTKRPEKIACPNCGYESVQVEDTKGLGCFIFLTIITGGLYLLFLVFDSLLSDVGGGMKQAKHGQKLQCSICYHAWENKSR